LIVNIPSEIVPENESVQLYAVDGLENLYPVGGAVDLRVSYSFTEISKLIGISLSIIHTLFFFFLIVAARWWGSAAAMLLDPLARSIGIWSGFALRYFPPLQRWLLRRWFDLRRRKGHLPEYLPLVLTNSQTGEIISSDELLDRCRDGGRVWLQGRPGMGKTVLASWLEERFFVEDRSLGDAINRRGYIPLLIKLREITVGASPVADGDLQWAARLAEKALARQGFLLDDRGASGSNLLLVSAIVQRSNFVLLLDGANEVPWSDQIGPAAVGSQWPGILVTSQGPPPNSGFEHWTLPDTIQRSIEPMLVLFMGEAKGRALFSSIASSPLIEEIRSGYDVRLVHRLAEAGMEHIPENRLSLYETMVGLAVGGHVGLADDLASFAWDIWLKGTRQFERSALPTDLSDQLLASETRLLREWGGRLEFIHDQVEAYLAARHIFNLQNPFRAITSAEASWSLMIRSAQADVWSFVNAMADTDTALKLYRWTLEQPEDRLELQISLKDRVRIISESEP
jgi:hypothetical protein